MPLIQTFYYWSTVGSRHEKCLDEKREILTSNLIFRVRYSYNRLDFIIHFHDLKNWYFLNFLSFVDKDRCFVLLFITYPLRSNSVLNKNVLVSYQFFNETICSKLENNFFFHLKITNRSRSFVSRSLKKNSKWEKQWKIVIKYKVHY